MSDDPTFTRFRIETSDGADLEAELRDPTGGEGVPPAGAVVVCHPHPLYGGSMDANVVDALFRALPGFGAAVVRFNFRGAGTSTGTHDEGRAERLDVAAAVAATASRFTSSSILLAGYSFGADVSLTVDDPVLSGWFAVAPPLRIVDPADMVAMSDPRPKTLLGAAHDQFNPYPKLVETVAGNPNTTVVEVEGADHFFMVGVDAIVDAAKTALGA